MRIKRQTSKVKRQISNIQYPISTLLAVCCLLLAACGAPKPKGEIIVYVAAPLSGFQANGGQTVLGGAKLMAEQLNKAGGLLGY
jgi:branched-chain amino acid transport system substrate-binding protein